MKKLFITGFLWGLLIPMVFSQTGEHTGGRFLKRIEYNLLMGIFNLDSKGGVEKLFFGDFNAPVEFLYTPSFDGSSGFRIVIDSAKSSYILEVKYISNYKEVRKETSEKYPMRGISLTDSRIMPKDTLDAIAEYNRAMSAKSFEESVKLYKVDTKTYPISNQFAENLYRKMVSTINNFKAKSIPGQIISDGYSVTFRTVVEDEVWSLNIHMPQGDARQVANLCRQIIMDTEANQFDESKYITQLLE